MALRVGDRMNIVRWMSVAKDDKKWDAREIRMLTEAAKKRNSDAFTKTGTRFMAELYRSPDTNFKDDKARKTLFEALVHAGMDPGELSGADATQTLQDFEALDQSGKLLFLRESVFGDMALQPVETDEISPRRVRTKIDGAVTRSLEERYQDDIDGGWTVEDLLRENRDDVLIETLERDGDRYGYLVNYTFDEGSTGTLQFFDNDGEPLGSVSRAEFLALPDAPDGLEPQIPDLSVESSHPDLKVSRRRGVVTIEDARSVPDGAMVTVRFDDQTLTLEKKRGRISLYDVRGNAPEGYGLEEVSGRSSSSTNKLKLRVSRDAPGMPSTDEALAAARRGLTEIVKRRRVHESDWRDFSSSWKDALDNGVMDGINAFGQPNDDYDVEISRSSTGYFISGPGPFGLHTELSLDKATCRVSSAYVEID